jgi:phenylalanyl-tRNA synthetase beta chain
MDVQHLLNYQNQEKIAYKAVSKFPAVIRDLAVILDKAIGVGEVGSFLKGRCGDILEEVAFFDLFEGKGIPEGKKSLAFRLFYRSVQRTLTENEVQTHYVDLLEALRRKWNAQLRGGNVMGERP